MKTLQTFLLTLVMVTACTTQPTYAPASRPDGAGYWETRLTETRYRVTFVGKTNTASDEVKNFALLRAAELTLQAGYDWFYVVDQDTERSARDRRPAVTFGVGTGCGVFGCRVIGSRWYTGVHLDSYHYAGRYRTSLEIVMGRGKPDDPNRVYDARELANHLRGSKQKGIDGEPATAD